MRALPFLLLAALILAAGAASAACPAPLPESSLQPGEYGLFFDPAGTVECQEAPVGVPFTLYAVARAPVGGMEAWVYPMDLQLDTEAVLVLGVDPPAEMLHVLVFDFCSSVVAEDRTTCAYPEGEVVPLFSVQVMRTGPEPWAVCSQALLCSLFAGPDEVPLFYAPCGTYDGSWSDQDVLTPHAPTCIRFDDVVAVEPENWGPWKARW